MRMKNSTYPEKEVENKKGIFKKHATAIFIISFLRHREKFSLFFLDSQQKIWKQKNKTIMRLKKKKIFNSYNLATTSESLVWFPHLMTYKPVWVI